MSGQDLAYLDPVLRPRAEEVVNSLTHGAGLALACVGACVLAAAAVAGGDAWRIAGCTIYGATMVAVYACSTLSHAVTGLQRKRFYRRLDQGFIYLLIVGTYTPFSLSYLRTTWGWIFLAIMWSVALAGFLGKVLWATRVDRISLWLYIALGWIPVLTAPSLVGRVPGAALWWMLIGGLCYTLGTIFLMLDRHWPHLHPVWHVCVIAGSAWHFFAILLFIAHPH